jgi:branched-subunit amino acid aminotransferase/4-amino-4-deoxychorismate lyase
MNDSRSDNPFAAGAAYIDGRYMPIAQAAIPITDWGYRRSDVTYDVVGVWEGNFFRLDDHIRRFRASMRKFRFEPQERDEEIKAVLNRCVALSGLKNAYVAMDCLRGRPAPGMPYHPAYARNYIVAFAIPWVWLMSLEVQERGVTSSSRRPCAYRLAPSIPPRRISIGPISPEASSKRSIGEPTSRSCSIAMATSRRARVSMSSS